MTTEQRLDVPSTDGTRLALWVTGSGRPLVLVHGSMQDHSANAALIEALGTDFRVHAMDRRGFGQSGDHEPWSIEREFEDVAAIVDHVAAATAMPVVLWGHSFGASCAMGGAMLSSQVSHLILYEPSLGLHYPDGVLDRIDTALASDDREAAATEVLAGVLELTGREIEAMKRTPRWATIMRSAHTIPREARAEQAWSYAGQFDALVAPVLMLTGSDSPLDIRRAHDAAASALGLPAVSVLAGHGHLAHRSDAPLVADLTRGFVLGRA